MMANGNIQPFYFVKQDTTTRNACLQASTGDRPIGVAQRGTRHPPGAFFNDDGFAAIQGEDIQIYTDDETCMLAIGGTVNIGDRLKPGPSGAVTANPGDLYGAIASCAAVAGDIIEVQVKIGYYNQ